mmetsp:Transcript_15920/g.43785  ORF Transcript_15920/g.43785 Transcript_15920/m.43785 type:complete len:253 (+) Transcript_15920:288-1046(+)
MTSNPLPFFLAWWLRITRLRPFRAQKALVTFQANRENRWRDEDRGDSWTPNRSWLLSASSSIGSDHMRSLTHSSSGLLRSASFSGLFTDCRSGNLQVPSPMPPCTTSTRFPTMHARGIKSKAFCMISNTFGPKSLPNLVLHSSSKPYFLFMVLSSWLPRTSQTLSGSKTLSESNKHTTSSWWEPRSTKSPLKTNMGASGTSGLPKAQKSSNKSRSCPCRSPKTRQGASASTTVGCAAKILHAALQTKISVSR